MSLSKVLVLVAVVIFAITAFLALAVDTTSLLHIAGGIALGCAVWASSALVP